jgi:hypothetical protein
MSASAGIAAGAAAQSAIAANQAHQAKVTACTKFVKGYAHDTASVAEVRQYASCANTLFPEPVSDGASLAIKAAIVIVLVCFVIGAARGDGYGDTSLSGRAYGALTWAIIAATTMVIGALGVLGVGYVFS